MAAVLPGSWQPSPSPPTPFALRAPWPAAPPGSGKSPTGRDATAHTRPFLLLAAALTLSGFALYAFVIGLVPLLTARGASTTTALLAATPGPVPLLIGLAMLAGMVRGNLTLLQATAITDRWGTTYYGRLSGLLAAPVTIAGAFAPVTGTALAAPLGGYPQLFTLLALISAIGAVLACGTRTESPATS